MVTTREMEAKLTALARECYEQAAELRGGSSLTVVSEERMVEARKWERLGYATLKARDTARENGL